MAWDDKHKACIIATLATVEAGFNYGIITAPDTLSLGIGQWTQGRAYDLLQDRKFIAWDSPEGKRVPLAFFNDKGVIAKHVTAAITVLTDGGYKDTEIFKHLFTEDDSLPGRPIDALHGHLAREVIRRAQAAAF